MLYLGLINLSFLQNTQIELSIIILCYRSGKSIVDFAHETLKIAESLTANYEIVLVGNYVEGSGDTTQQYVEQLAQSNSRFKAICKPKEGMMGWDMKEGLNVASGKYLCVIDGDGQFPIESISQCYNKIAEGGYDLVKTYRSVRNDGLYRTVISFVYNLVFRALFGNFKVRDVNSKPKILTKNAYQQMTLLSDDWFIDAEIMLNVRDLKMKFYEFPVEFLKLEGRHSFVKFSAIWEFIKNLVSYRFKR